MIKLKFGIVMLFAMIWNFKENKYRLCYIAGKSIKPDFALNRINLVINICKRKFIK